MKLWERHCLKEIFKMLLIILSCFYLIFVLIDYALHTKAFSGGSVPFGQLVEYYGFQFSKQLQLLLPFALLLSGIKVLTTLNLHNELVALLAAGLKPKKLVRPLAIVGLLSASLLWANSQWIYPIASAQTEHFERTHFQATRGADHHLNTVRLKDGSTLLYQGWDRSLQAFVDAIWLRSSHELYRIKELYPLEEEPRARFVDSLTKDDEGAFSRAQSWDERPFPEMRFDSGELFTAVRPPAQMPLSLLWQHRPKAKNWRDRDSRLLTQLNLKLALPLICLFVVLLPAAWCLRFSRRPAIFLLYTLSIGSYLAFLTTMDAATILGENGVFSPIWVVWTPLLALGGFTAFRFARV